MAPSPDLSQGRPDAGQDASEHPAVSPTALIEGMIRKRFRLKAVRLLVAETEEPTEESRKSS
jgi:hypothetical protein